MNSTPADSKARQSLFRASSEATRPNTVQVALLTFWRAQQEIIDE
jgi:hypothetical protein